MFFLGAALCFFAALMTLLCIGGIVASFVFPPLLLLALPFAFLNIALWNEWYEEEEWGLIIGTVACLAIDIVVITTYV